MSAALERRLERRAEWQASRNVRVREVKPRTVGYKRISKRSLNVVYDYPTDIPRPRTRGECAGVPRPCPFVSCRYHLYLDVTQLGSLRLNFPDLEPDELEHSCCLDLADEGRLTLQQVAVTANVTRERVRQVERRILRKLAAPLAGWRDKG